MSYKNKCWIGATSCGLLVDVEQFKWCGNRGLGIRIRLRDQAQYDDDGMPARIVEKQTDAPYEGFASDTPLCVILDWLYERDVITYPFGGAGVTQWDTKKQKKEKLMILAIRIIRENKLTSITPNGRSRYDIWYRREDGGYACFFLHRKEIRHLVRFHNLEETFLFAR